MAQIDWPSYRLSLSLGAIAVCTIGYLVTSIPRKLGQPVDMLTGDVILTAPVGALTMPPVRDPDRSDIESHGLPGSKSRGTGSQQSRFELPQLSNAHIQIARSRFTAQTPNGNDASLVLARNRFHENLGRVKPGTRRRVLRTLFGSDVPGYGEQWIRDDGRHVGYFLTATDEPAYVA